MKNTLVMFIVLSISICTKAQDFKENYLGQDFLFYKGAFLLLNKSAYFGLDYKFYSDIKYCQSHYDKNVIYPDGKNYFTTKKDSLLNRIFLVKEILNPSGEVYKNQLLSEQPIFVLEDTVTKQEIFFKYDMRSESSFPFFTSEIILNEKDVCSRIERQIDEFTNVIKFNSPLSKTYYSLSPIIIYKEIAKAKSSYYLSLRTGSNTVVVDGTGVIILFTDGTKWVKPVKIDVEADKNGYEYRAFIVLNQTDLSTFSTKKIKKFRLYIFDEDISEFEAEKFQSYTKCIRLAK